MKYRGGVGRAGLMAACLLLYTNQAGSAKVRAPLPPPCWGCFSLLFSSDMLCLVFDPIHSVPRDISPSIMMPHAMHFTNYRIAVHVYTCLDLVCCVLPPWVLLNSAFWLMIVS